MVAKRGVMFEFDTSMAPGAHKALEAIEKRVDALQKRMHLTLDVTERAARARAAPGAGAATNGTNGGTNGSPSTTAARQTASDAAMAASRRKLSDLRRAADERDRLRAEKTARDTAAFNQDILDQQIKDLKKAEANKQKLLSVAAKRQKAEALREQRSDKAYWDDFEKYGEDRAKAQAASVKRIAAEQKKADREKQQAEREQESSARRQAEAQNRVREGIYGTVHAFGQLTRAAAQFGLVGQRDMMKVLDTIFAVEGSINALQGVMGAARAIGGMRGAAGAAGGVRNLGPAAALSA
ncbi:MAG: hypothetical protein KGL35_17365, partial [Bradyrhizobium sp.]|nr:hypothetical protein [Bradyrhizobium sp.]